MKSSGPSEDVSLSVRDFIVRSAADDVTIERVILFGSRARGDARERSDFDFAVVAPTMTDSQWSRFALKVEESVPTLCAVDLLRLDHTKGNLRQRIEQEGVIIYERAA